MPAKFDFCWWEWLTIEEKFAVKYLDLYKRAKEFGFKYSEIKKFLPAPPNLKKERFCSICGRKIWRMECCMGKIGTDIHYCWNCYKKM